MSVHTIAIDGPAASGKSTVGQQVAERLGFLYFDTGALYRAITFLALERGLALDDEGALVALSEETTIEVEPCSTAQQDGRQYSVLVGGRDITWELRHHLVDKHVSQVAAHPGVRQALMRQQRRIGLRGGVVMVGRDIGTVVMYDAPLKIFLDASVEERARRRYEELRRRGAAVAFDTLLADMRERDRRDSTRAHSPLRPAPDAQLINSSDLPIEQVVAQIVALAEGTLPIKQRAGLQG